MRFLIITLCILPTFFGCSTALTEKGRTVEFKDFDPKGCNLLGYTEAQDNWTVTRQTVENKIRNQAAKMGGDIAVIDDQKVAASWMSAAVYACPKQ